jgi:hypothetical protein
VREIAAAMNNTELSETTCGFYGRFVIDESNEPDQYIPAVAVQNKTIASSGVKSESSGLKRIYSLRVPCKNRITGEIYDEEIIVEDCETDSDLDEMEICDDSNKIGASDDNQFEEGEEEFSDKGVSSDSRASIDRIIDSEIALIVEDNDEVLLLGGNASEAAVDDDIEDYDNGWLSPISTGPSNLKSTMKPKKPLRPNEPAITNNSASAIPFLLSALSLSLSDSGSSRAPSARAERHPNSRIHELCGAMQNLVTHEANRKLFGNLGLPKLLVRALKVFEKEGPLVFELCGIIRNMAVTGSNSEVFGRAGGISILVEILEAQLDQLYQIQTDLDSSSQLKPLASSSGKAETVSSTAIVKYYSELETRENYLHKSLCCFYHALFLQKYKDESYEAASLYSSLYVEECSSFNKDIYRRLRFAPSYVILSDEEVETSPSTMASISFHNLGK